MIICDSQYKYFVNKLKIHHSNAGHLQFCTIVRPPEPTATPHPTFRSNYLDMQNEVSSGNGWISSLISIFSKVMYSEAEENSVQEMKHSKELFKYIRGESQRNPDFSGQTQLSHNEDAPAKNDCAGLVNCETDSV